MKRTHKSFDLVNLENDFKKCRYEETIYEAESLSDEMNFLALTKLEESTDLELKSFVTNDFSIVPKHDIRAPVVVFKEKKCLKEQKIREYPIYLVL